MTLGDELRAALNQEADMQDVAGPDVDRLIVGGQVRRRRRTMSRIGGTALAVVLVGGGVYAVTQGGIELGGSGVATQPAAPSETSGAAAAPDLEGNSGAEDLEPGTYRLLVGGDADGEPLEADLTFEGAGWWSGNFPVLRDGETYGGIGVYRPFALSAGSGCAGGPLDGDVARSPQSLARQLAKLPRSTVVQPVTPTEALGRDALHLRLRVSQNCSTQGEGFYLVAETARGSRGITYGVPHTKVIDFWVLDVDGATVVVDAWHNEGASASFVDRITQAKDSITFVSRT